MAISDTVVTLADYGRMSNDPLVKYVSYQLAFDSRVLERLPLQTKPTFKVNGTRFTDAKVPINWRKLNAEPVNVKDVPKPWEEQVYIMSNVIDIDRLFLIEENQVTNPQEVQLIQTLRSASYDINDKFINNDPVSGNPDAPVGIRYRLDNPTMYGIPTELKINGNAVDMRVSDSTAATASTFISLIQQLLINMAEPDGNGVTLFINDRMSVCLEAAIRKMGAGAGFSMTKDAFDRSVWSYRNAQIVDIGRKGDQSTRIITSTENADGTPGSSNTTSIYAVKFDKNYLGGWQMQDMNQSIQNLGRIGNAGTMERLLIDYAFGWYQEHIRSIGRIFNVRVN